MECTKVLFMVGLHPESLKDLRKLVSGIPEVIGLGSLKMQSLNNQRLEPLLLESEVLTMRIKINGHDIEKGDRVTFESSDFPTGYGLMIIVIGLVFVAWIVFGCVFA